MLEKLVLHDVRDAEALVAGVVRRSKHRELLLAHEVEDVIAHCLLDVWRASAKFDRTRGSFSNLATVVASRAIVGYLRHTRGRSRWQFSDYTHERELPQFVSLDDERAGAGLGLSLGDGTSDRSARTDTALARLLDERGCSVALDTALIRAAVTRRARSRGQRHVAAGRAA